MKGALGESMPAGVDFGLRTILLATDGSDHAHAALNAAADLASRSGAALHLVTAYHLPPATLYAHSGTLDQTSVADPFETAANARLERERVAVEALGAHVAALHARSGPVVSAVIGVADQVDADLIVVGSRHMHGLQRLLAGSVSAHVLHASHRPVLIVRGDVHCWPPAQIIVGFDESVISGRAARAGATLADLYDGSVVSLVEAEPDPRLVLARESDREGQNLVVVGTRGHGTFRRLLQGSVSTRMLNAGHAPLLVVPEHRALGGTPSA
jgi:nucleotide-binding universal stress UspA family protein